MRQSRVAIIGSGRVASALAVAFAGCKGIDLTQIIARDRVKGEILANRCGVSFCEDFRDVKGADLYVVAVSDRSIGEVSERLSSYIDDSAVVCHTSGSVALGVLSLNIKNRAVLYPLYSFAEGLECDFGEIPLLVEGNSDETLEFVRSIASMISLSVAAIESKKREKIHLAAVFFNNFVNHIFVAAESIVVSENLPKRVLDPLIEQTLKAIVEGDPLKNQSGPARRGDLPTMKRHMELLSDNEEFRAIYEAMSNSIIKLYRDE